MLTVLVDYGAGNLHSAEKAFQRMAQDVSAGEILVSGRAEDVARADRIVLPGDGAFPACMAALKEQGGLDAALREAVEVNARPFLGICVGMQMLAGWGREYRDTPGLGWIDGDVVKIEPGRPGLKVPHMGWNELVIDRRHKVLEGIDSGAHAYFVHSYQFRVADTATLMAHADYGGPVTAIVAKGPVVGMQFHPEKSQAAGLRMIANFLTWTP